jgi:hypothetical protein
LNELVDDTEIKRGVRFQAFIPDFGSREQLVSVYESNGDLVESKAAFSKIRTFEYLIRNPLNKFSPSSKFN